jgi:hypothetical protein
VCAEADLLPDVISRDVFSQDHLLLDEQQILDIPSAPTAQESLEESSPDLDDHEAPLAAPSTAPVQAAISAPVSTQARSRRPRSVSTRCNQSLLILLEANVALVRLTRCGVELVIPFVL